ncbi:MAG: stage III sporulation protein AF [Prevotella sp.]|nr:stage III sporulation protein AF [Prevotella sp.]
METFRAVSVTACFLSIVIAIFGSLYPSEKFAGQLKMIFSLIFILSLIKPVLNGKLNLPEITETAAASTSDYEALRSGADEYFIRSAEKNIGAVLEASLHEIGIYPEEIETSINISENYSISINEVKIVLKTENAGSAEAAKSRVSEQAGDSAAVAVVFADNGEETGKEERQ